VCHPSAEQQYPPSSTIHDARRCRASPNHEVTVSEDRTDNAASPDKTAWTKPASSPDEAVKDLDPRLSEAEENKVKGGAVDAFIRPLRDEGPEE
jgi:hypothetical protein